MKPNLELRMKKQEQEAKDLAELIDEYEIELALAQEESVVLHQACVQADRLRSYNSHRINTLEQRLDTLNEIKNENIKEEK